MSVQNRWDAVPLEYPDVRNINQSFSPERQKYRSYSNALLFWRYIESWRQQDRANLPLARYLVLSAYVYASTQARKNPKYSSKTPRQGPTILRHLEHVGDLTYQEFRDQYFAIENCDDFYVHEPGLSTPTHDRCWHYIKWDLAKRLHEIRDETDGDYYVTAHDNLFQDHLRNTNTYNLNGYAEETTRFRTNSIPKWPLPRKPLTLEEYQQRQSLIFENCSPYFTYDKHGMLKGDYFPLALPMWQRKFEEMTGRPAVTQRSKSSKGARAKTPGGARSKTPASGRDKTPARKHDRDRRRDQERPQRDPGDVSPSPDRRRSKESKEARKARRDHFYSVDSQDYRSDQIDNTVDYYRMDPGDEDRRKSRAPDQRRVEYREEKQEKQEKLDQLRHQSVKSKVVKPSRHSKSASASGGASAPGDYSQLVASQSNSKKRASSERNVEEQAAKKPPLIYPALPEGKNHTEIYQWTVQWIGRPIERKERPPRWIDDLVTVRLPTDYCLEKLAIEVARIPWAILGAEIMMGTNYAGGRKYYDFYTPLCLQVWDFGFRNYRDFTTEDGLRHMRRIMSLCIALQYYSNEARPDRRKNDISPSVHYIRTVLLGNGHGGEKLLRMLDPKNIVMEEKKGRLSDRPRGDIRYQPPDPYGADFYEITEDPDGFRDLNQGQDSDIEPRGLEKSDSATSGLSNKELRYRDDTSMDTTADSIDPTLNTKASDTSSASLVATPPPGVLDTESQPPPIAETSQFVAMLRDDSLNAARHSTPTPREQKEDPLDVSMLSADSKTDFDVQTEAREIVNQAIESLADDDSLMKEEASAGTEAESEEFENAPSSPNPGESETVGLLSEEEMRL